MRYVLITALSLLMGSPAIILAQGKDTSISVKVRLQNDSVVKIEKATVRLELEHAFKLRTEEALREKVKLDEDQIAQVRKVVAKYGPLKHKLFQQSQMIGMELRRESAKGDSADQKRVSELMKTSTELQKRFVKLVEEEDKELAAFMTPVQIVQYKSIQSQLRLRLLEGRKPHARGKIHIQKEGGKIKIRDSSQARPPAH